VVIKNSALPPPTLATDIDGGGSFFVDLCISTTGTPAQPTLPLSPSNKWCSKAYANMDKSLLGPETTYSITRWFNSATDKPVDLLTLFTPGTYTVMVAVDSYVSNPAQSPKGYVDEGSQGGENNNVSQAVTFTVDQVGRVIYIPVARHK
jgi:hypothetical protein